MKSVGTVLPTRSSLALEERCYRNDCEKRLAEVKRLGLEALPQAAAQMPDLTKYFLPDGRWLEVDLGGRCRMFELRPDGEHFVRFVKDPV